MNTIVLFTFVILSIQQTPTVENLCKPPFGNHIQTCEKINSFCNYICDTGFRNPKTKQAENTAGNCNSEAQCDSICKLVDFYDDSYALGIERNFCTLTNNDYNIVISYNSFGEKMCFYLKSTFANADIVESFDVDDSFYRYASNVAVRCRENYAVRNSVDIVEKTFECKSGVLFDTQNGCVRICDKINPASGSNWSYSSDSSASKITEGNYFTGNCFDGFFVSSTSNLRSQRFECQNTGDFIPNPASFRCISQTVVCRVQPGQNHISPSNPTIEAAAFNTFTDVICDSGYLFDDTVTCLENGFPSGNLCVQIYCFKGQVLDGEYHADCIDRQRIKSSCSFDCLNGVLSNGKASSIISCTSSDSRSLEPNCIRYKCFPPISRQNLIIFDSQCFNGRRIFDRCSLKAVGGYETDINSAQCTNYDTVNPYRIDPNALKCLRPKSLGLKQNIVETEKSEPDEIIGLIFSGFYYVNAKKGYSVNGVQRLKVSCKKSKNLFHASPSFLYVTANSCNQPTIDDNIILKNSNCLREGDIFASCEYIGNPGYRVDGNGNVYCDPEGRTVPRELESIENICVKPRTKNENHLIFQSQTMPEGYPSITHFVACITVSASDGYGVNGEDSVEMCCLYRDEKLVPSIDLLEATLINCKEPDYNPNHVQAPRSLVSGKIPGVYQYKIAGGYEFVGLPSKFTANVHCINALMPVPNLRELQTKAAICLVPRIFPEDLKSHVNLSNCNLIETNTKFSAKCAVTADEEYFINEVDSLELVCPSFVPVINVRKKFCDKVIPKNGTLSSSCYDEKSQTLIGRTCPFQCNPGHRISGTSETSKTLGCLPDGSLIFVARCDPILCKSYEIPPSANGKLNCDSDSIVEGKCEFECNKNHILPDGTTSMTLFCHYLFRNPILTKYKPCVKKNSNTIITFVAISLSLLFIIIPTVICFVKKKFCFRKKHESVHDLESKKILT